MHLGGLSADLDPSRPFYYAILLPKTTQDPRQTGGSRTPSQSPMALVLALRVFQLLTNAEELLPHLAAAIQVRK